MKKTGKKIWLNSGVLLLWCPSPLAYSRWAFSVPAKLGSSPLRNRWKRQVRELLRQWDGFDEKPMDLHFILVEKRFGRGGLKKHSQDLFNPQLRQDLQSALRDVSRRYDTFLSSIPEGLDGRSMSV